MITVEQVEKDPSLREKYFLEIAEACGILVVSDSIIQAVYNQDRKLSNISHANWTTSAILYQDRIEAELNRRGDYWTINRGISVIHAAAVKTFDSLSQHYNSKGFLKGE